MRGLAVCLVLAGCAGGPVVNAAGDDTALCERRCNRAADICGESHAAHASTTYYGAASECRAQLHSCLGHCSIN